MPANRLNTVTARLGQFYPLPNLPGSGAAGTGINPTENTPILEAADRESLRIDHKLTDRSQLAYSALFVWFGHNPSPSHRVRSRRRGPRPDLRPLEPRRPA